MKTQRNRIHLCLLLAALCALPSVVRAQSVNGLCYTTNNGAITITGYNCTGSGVFIPGTINGLPVTSIGDGAFLDCERLTSVTIPNGVTSIGDNAFIGCLGLASVTIPKSLSENS